MNLEGHGSRAHGLLLCVPGRARLPGSKSLLCFAEAGTEVIGRTLRGTAVYGIVRAMVQEDGGNNPASYPILQSTSFYLKMMNRAMEMLIITIHQNIKFLMPLLRGLSASGSLPHFGFQMASLS